MRRAVWWPAMIAAWVWSCAPAAAVPGGLLRVLLKGYWVCEAQNDATAPPERRPQDSFRVIADSSYRTNAGQSGSYLLLGNDLVMTGGPFRGRRYVLIGQGILHPIDTTGTRTTARCVRQNSGGDQVSFDSGDPAP